jgi:hypothetical protein
VTLFVEEGKHGTAPDRNAEGAYMRGYDVTERVNDAWGIRDSLGQGVLLSPGYASEMTKPRTQAFRLLPPESAYLQVTPRQRSYRDGEPSMGRYELRPANTVAACAAIPTDRARLISMMAEHRFGVDELPTQYKSGSVDRALSELSLPDSWLSASLRLSGDTLGAALIFKGLDMREGWIVPRTTISGQDVTGELLFTPSASAVRHFAGETHDRHRAGPSGDRSGDLAQLEDRVRDRLPVQGQAPAENAALCAGLQLRGHEVRPAGVGVRSRRSVSVHLGSRRRSLVRHRCGQPAAVADRLGDHHD